MDTDRWSRLQDLFHRAADLPPADRQTFVDVECAHDAALRDELLSLLAVDSAPGGLLDQGLAQVAHAVFETSQPDALPLNLDLSPYRLLRVLGEGGMGIVYLAERPDLQNLVAIKLLRDAHLSSARRERFATEQRILAQLSHPAIARLYDAKTLGDGTPCFVMEYVEGLPLTEYCQLHQSSIPERLKLLRAVCEAVQYAHAHALIHRDLKPSNILVKSDGSVRLLDFGIAKQLDSPGTADHTLTGLRLMTPAYAAPEQIKGNQAGIRTDVYSLGVILYELIAGQPPFDLSTRTPGEAELIILNEQPAKPSTTAQAAGRNKPESGKVDWDDLDVLCRVAMHKEPDRRYPSVEALMRDIDHYLQGEPLEARPDSLTYKTGKFLRRNRRPVLAASLFFFTLVGVITFFVVHLARAKNQALAQAAKSKRIEHFMLHLFDGDRSDSQSGPSSELRATDVLDRGAREAERLKGVPQVQAELYQTLGDLYEKLGNFDRADRLLRSALTARLAIFGKQSTPVAETMVTLANLESEQSKLPEALPLAREGVSIDSKLLPPNDPTLARDRIQLGRVLARGEKYVEARRVLNTAIEPLSRPGAPASDLAMALDSLAEINIEDGQFALARSELKSALAIERRTYGDSHVAVGMELINLGSLEMQLQNFAESERDYRQGLEIARSWFGENNVNVASASMLLGQVLLKEGRQTEAKPYLKTALQIQEKMYGENNRFVAVNLNALAIAAQREGKSEEAEAYFNRVLAIEGSLHGGKSPTAAICLMNLADLYRGRVQYVRAEEFNRRALEVAEQVLPPDHLYSGAIQLSLGKTLFLEKRYRAAQPYLQAAYSILQKQGNPNMPTFQEARRFLASNYLALGQPTAARELQAKLTPALPVAK